MEKCHSVCDWIAIWQFMSKGYDDFERFRVFAGKELKRLSTKLEELAIELNRVSRSIDEFQEYSYQ